MAILERNIPFFSALALLICFGLLGAFTVLDIVDGPGTLRQERTAATPAFPKNLSGLPRYLADARWHAKERYALKETFVAANAAIKLRLFGRSDVANVALGENGFLFLVTDETVLTAQGLRRLDAAGAAKWRDYFRQVKAAFDTRDIPFGLLIGPNKHSIYPDYLPDWLVPAPADQTRTQDVFKVGFEELGQSFFDTRQILAVYRQANPDSLLFHPTDTHWNELGAAISVKELFRRMGFDLPVPDYPVERLPRSGDLARMMGRQNAMDAEGPRVPRTWTCRGSTGAPLPVETIDPLMPRQFACGNPDGRPEKIVAFIDSFGVSAIPYLASNFKHIEFIWSDAADAGKAKEMGADLVVQILVERKLMTDTPIDFLDQESRTRD